MVAYKSFVWTVGLPQASESLRRRQLANVHADETQNENSVSAEVVLGEFGQGALGAMRSIEGTKLLFHVAQHSWPKRSSIYPLQEVHKRHRCNEHVPRHKNKFSLCQNILILMYSKLQYLSQPSCSLLQPLLNKILMFCYLHMVM